MKDLHHPTPQEMTGQLLETARQGLWSHWKKDFAKHRNDWLKATKKPLTDKQFAELPAALASHQHVELCTYNYNRPGRKEGILVWGFYREHLDFQRMHLTRVAVVYNPVSGEIVHCMRLDKGRRYFEQYFDGGEVKVRWP